MKIRARHHQAIEHLSSGMQLEECARMVGVTSRSIYNWCEDPEFSKLLRERESEKIRRLNTRHIMASERALEVLLNGLESRSESIRIRSAQVLKAGLSRSIELHDLYDIVEKLEVKFEATKHTRR